MSRSSVLIACASLLAIHFAHAHTTWKTCEVRARFASGWVCGTRQYAGRGRHYASFKGVPYAKQPVGELRFKELEPVEPWNYLLDARNEGYICPQHDILYGELMKPRGMDERCIHANIHVPIEALPYNQGRPVRDLKFPVAEAQDEQEKTNSTGLPILVFIHGGGFAFGSGGTDLHGPEYLVKTGVIVITFNYRLNVFGFLSLNSAKIPGNNGLRDMVTLLRWVRDNARYFGGNPDDVTIGGQSAGAVAAHLLTLSPLARGLFNKAIIMSGTALPSFYSTTPAYAKFVSQTFVTALGINSTDPDEIHQILVETPIDKLMAVNRVLQDQTGLALFFPVIESSHPGVNSVLLEDTEDMIAKGYGSDIPLIIGFTNEECQTFKKRFEEIDIMNRIKANPLLVLSPQVIFTHLPEVALERAMTVEKNYFNGTPTLDKFIDLCSETYFQYPALKLAQYRSKTGGAPVYLYEFSYSANTPIKYALGENFPGAGHVEDLVYIFEVTSVEVPNPDLEPTYMKNIMVYYFSNFIRGGEFETQPAAWLPLGHDDIRLLNIESPQHQFMAEPSSDQHKMMQFLDGISARS